MILIFREDAIWIYGSTSHGTHLWTGAEYLNDNIDPPTHAFAKDWWDPPARGETPHLAMGYDDGWSWDPDEFIPKAREMLDSAPKATAFMWSWCGEMGYEDTDVQRYLDMMSRLERQYPHVRFVYMTGHTNGDNDTLNHNNDLIQRYVEEHNGSCTTSPPSRALTRMAIRSSSPMTAAPGVPVGALITLSSARICPLTMTNAPTPTASTANSKRRPNRGYPPVLPVGMGALDRFGMNGC